MEAGGTQEVWTVTGPGKLWEFCFDKSNDFHFFCYIFRKPYFYFFIFFEGHCSAKKNSGDAFILLFCELEISRATTRVCASVCVLTSDCLL